MPGKNIDVCTGGDLWERTGDGDLNSANPCGGTGGDLVRPAVVGAAYTVQSTENSIAVLNDTDKDTWVKAGDFLAHSEKLRTNDMGTQEVEPVDKNLTDDQIKAHKAQIWSDLNLEENKILKEHPEAMKRVRRVSLGNLTSQPG